MKIRLGYVAISKTIDITCSHTITYTNYLKEKNGIEKIDNIIRENLTNLEKIIDYNIKNNIHFYRLSSKLIPLATKKDIEFDYITPYKSIYKRIATKIAKSNMRVDFHPDEYCILNSVNKDVLENTYEILKYHYNILTALNIKNKLLVIHIGSNVFGKEKSLSRFINFFNKLPEEIQKTIAIENDDKIFTIEDTLQLCEKLNCPCILDYHHYTCNKNEDINNYYERIFKTWKNINPKIHFSSPKNLTKKDIRSHNDYINPNDFIIFLESIKNFNYDIDIMLEAKAKDEALFKLIRQLKFKTNYVFIDETTFILK